MTTYAAINIRFHAFCPDRHLAPDAVTLQTLRETFERT
jgi:hypothetical protein